MLLLSSINLQSAVSLVNFMVGDREFDARKVYNLTTNWIKYIKVLSRLSTCGFTLSVKVRCDGARPCPGWRERINRRSS